MLQQAIAHYHVPPLLKHALRLSIAAVDLTTALPRVRGWRNTVETVLFEISIVTLYNHDITLVYSAVMSFIIFWAATFIPMPMP